MYLTLLVPGLLWPREILRDTLFDLPLPALALLLGRGRHHALPSAEAWLAASFDLDTPLPAAPLRLLGDGGQPGEALWLCLDPVHLRLQERAMVVDDPARLALGAEEDADLRAAVAPLLAPLGEVVAPVPGRWHLRLHHGVALDTRSLGDAVGQPADPALPGGADGAAWRRRLAEAQTLLHAHPVNRRRDDAGLPTANTLWPWGLGRLPAAARCGFESLWTGDPAMKGLAATAGIAVDAIPAGLAAAPPPMPRHVLAHLDHLAAATARGDALAWREALARLEADWLAPAVLALRAGRCRQLSLIAAGAGHAIKTTVGRGDVWKFWRRPLPLQDLAP